jgi:hypothetical protein
MLAGPTDTNWLVNFFGKYADELRAAHATELTFSMTSAGNLLLIVTEAMIDYDRGILQD